MIHLELAQVPLQGRVLIEASAGTGKTWTIAALYVRLLLESRLQVQNLLVLTFTNAATAELRARIRQRLISVREALENPQAFAKSEDVLLRYLVSRSADLHADRLWINAAIENFDLASIYTIHAFCQRALVEHAFESGKPFDSELLNEDQPLLEMMVRDCWRIDMQTTHPLWAAWLDSQAINPHRLAEKIAILHRCGTAAVHRPPVPPESLIEDYMAVLETCRSIWLSGAREAYELIEASKTLSKTNYNKKRLPIMWARIEVALVSPVEGWLSEVERFTPAGLRANLKAGEGTPPEHPFFEALGCWHTAHLRLLDAFNARLAHWTVSLAHQVDARLRTYKQERRLQSYDDLLRELDEALNGEGGTVLAAGLHRRYAAALIDEFQDTDPRQYGIFEKIYAGTDALRCFVGDPKQAIYSFRGADVHAYLRARHEAQSGFTLGVNRRSVPPLVGALNRLFGANPRAFIEKGIEFLPVDPIPADESLHIEAEIETASLQCWFMAREGEEKQITKGRAHVLAAESAAEEIARLLTLSAQGRACMRGSHGERRLAGRDIAVLVRKHSQASRVREALAARGVASVTYGQDSVYRSAEAVELTRVLRGIAEVSREDLLIAALGTELLGRGARALVALREDDAAWAGIVERFAGYHSIAQEQGFIRMWRKLLADENVPARLLSFADGARRLTNVQHLADLLHQAACDEGLDLEQLVRLLEREAAVEGNKVEAHQLRLESDENLVQILTVHTAKGLEFPIVFCPYLWDDKVKEGELVSFHLNDMPAVDLGSTELETHRLIAKEEELAERLRLAYVALTRAKHRCVFAWGAAKDAEDSALAWLLHGKDCESGAALVDRFKEFSDAQLRGVLEQLVDQSEGAFSVRPCPQGFAERVVADEIAPSLRARVF
ncbi:MAG TPA: UvrD-helicase domain-containing protein, partial [Burkholderiales bacterium]|nr:UvrD-helicase domain-containing protein [Burkholderiales bacterium]